MLVGSFAFGLAGKRVNCVQSCARCPDRRRGLRRLVLGSDAEQVVRTARVPVLLVRARPG